MDKPECSCRERGSGRRIMVMPPIIPWEAGTNKCASQKGSGGFGSPRSNTLSIFSTKNLSESNDGVVPQITCLPLHIPVGSQKGETSFGSHRPQVTTVRTDELPDKIPINKITKDNASEKILKRWSQPNPEANNSKIGKSREILHESQGETVRKLSKEEEQRCKAAIPRFCDPSSTIAAQNEKKLLAQFGGRRHRSTISAKELSVLDCIERQRYLAWMGGQVTTVTSSPRKDPLDMSHMTLYERLMYERQFDPKVLHKKLQREQAAREKERENSVGGSQTPTSDSCSSSRGPSSEKEN